MHLCAFSNRFRVDDVVLQGSLPRWGDHRKTLPRDDQGGIKGGLDRASHVETGNPLLRYAARPPFCCAKGGGFAGVSRRERVRVRVVGAEVRRAGEHARSISFVIICVMPSDRNRTRTARARGLRRNSTDAERRLWTALRDSGFNHAKFRRQTPIGKYIVDFVSFRHKLVIGNRRRSSSGRGSVDIRRHPHAVVAVPRFPSAEVLEQQSAFRTGDSAERRI